MSESIGMIGLGRMGTPMAENLMKAGFSLRVYNRTESKAALLVEQGATFAKTPTDSALPGGIVLSMVADDQALLELADDSFCSTLGSGIHVSLSTISPNTNRTLAERHGKFGGHVVGAPVFGRPDAVSAGKLWVCVSGAAAAKSRVRPILDALGQGVFDFGEEVGAANVVKLCGNFLITSAMEAMAEASALAEKNGIPRADLLGMLMSTLFNCPIYQNYGRGIINADFSNPLMTIPLILKDMKLIQQTAAESRAPMPIVNLLCDRYLSTIAKGRESYDAMALSLLAAEDAGLNWEK